MTTIEIRRRLNRMSAQVDWNLQQRNGQKAPKVAAVARPVVEEKKEAPVQVAEPVTAVVTPELPAPVATIDEPIAAEPTMSLDEVRGLGDTELVDHWEVSQNAENKTLFERDILRRARKRARKAKIALPEGKCEGENVRNFIKILCTEVPVAE